MFDIDERFLLSGNATPHLTGTMKVMKRDQNNSDRWASLVSKLRCLRSPATPAWMHLCPSSEDLSLDEPLSEKGASSEEIKGVDTGRWILRTVRQAKNNNVPVPRDIIRNEQN